MAATEQMDDPAPDSRVGTNSSETPGAGRANGIAASKVPGVFFARKTPSLFLIQFFAMQIIVEVQNQKKLDLLIELLNSLEFVKSIRLADAPMNVVPTKVKGSFFSRYYGSLKTGLTPDEIDQNLNSLRKDWEHDTFHTW